MEKSDLGGIVIENDLDKECTALGGLFQQIINEMKNGIPNFEEFVTKATKLHGTLKTTIAVLGSFLDTFQKIADAATNTKGATRDVGTCLTRIVMRHRAMESRMKTLAGAVLDCMVMPIQNKLEEWKKVANALDKEHAREFKKHRLHIKKKSDQVQRLRKKLRKDPRNSLRINGEQRCSSNSLGSQSADPSVQRLLDGCTKDLNGMFRQLEEREKKFLRAGLVEERSRYCTFANCLKPVIDEEFGMLAELQQVEEVMVKLGKVTSNPNSLPDDVCSNLLSGLDHNATSSFCFSTPPSTPSPSMGSRKNSLSSISSLVSAASSRASSMAQQPSSSSFDACSPTHFGRVKGRSYAP